MALTKVTGQVIKNTTDVTVGVLTVTNTLAVGGTVSIGGTLTYEDVTNVDAVGLITARNGIVVGSGITLSKDGDIFATGITTVSGNVKVGTGITLSPDGDGFFTGVITATSYSGIDLSDVTGATGDFSIADKIVHTGDTNTAIRFPAADTVSVETGGSERLRIDSSGRLLFGIDSSISGIPIQIASGYIQQYVAGNDANPGYLDILKTRNTSASGNTILQDGDKIGSFRFRGNTGSGYVNGAVIRAVVNGTPGSGNDLPTDLQFHTMPDGSGSTLERLRIEADGDFRLSSGDAGDVGTNYAFIRAWQSSTGDMIIGADQSATGTNGSNLIFRTRGSEKVRIEQHGTLKASKNLSVTGIATATQFAATEINNGRKNLLINGEMKVNQRVGSSGLSYFNPVTSAVMTLDRWKVMNGSSFDTDSAHIHQSTSAPTQHGFGNSMKWEIGNTETPSSNQNCGIEQKIEGLNLQHLCYGTSNAKTMTLSFWVRSNKTGTYNVHIMQEDGTKYQMHEYTIDSSNTWEKKTIKIVGNTANAINNDNTTGLRIIWVLTVGSSDHVSATSTWASGGDLAGTSNQVNLWDNGSNEWYLTGCQLEVGEIATAYEHVPLSEELERCQRYYEKSYNLATRPGDVDNDGSVMFLSNRNNGTAHTMLRFMTRKRANPTVTAYDPTQANTTGMRDLDASQTYNYTMNRMGEMGCTAYPTGNLALGQFIQFHYTAESEL